MQSEFLFRIEGSADEISEILSFLQEGEDYDEEECILLKKLMKKRESSEECLVFKSNRASDFHDLHPIALVEMIASNFPGTVEDCVFEEDRCTYRYTSAMGDVDVKTDIENQAEDE